MHENIVGFESLKQDANKFKENVINVVDDIPMYDYIKDSTPGSLSTFFIAFGAFAMLIPFFPGLILFVIGLILMRESSRKPRKYKKTKR